MVRIADVGLWAFLVLVPTAALAASPFNIASADTANTSYATVLAIAKQASALFGLDVRPRPFKSTTQGLSFVDSGEVAFGLESSLGLTQAYNGLGTFAGTPLQNLRLVATIYPFRIGMFVKDSDPARSIADLKGRRIGIGFRAAPNINALVQAMLATSSLTYADVKGTPVATTSDSQDGMIAGAFDSASAIVNSPAMQEAQQAVGPVRMLALGTDQGAEARAQAFVPGAHIMVVDPVPGTIGIATPTPLLTYSYFVYASTSTPDDEVVGIIDTIVKGYKDMVPMASGFAYFDPKDIAEQIGVPYHPAAEAHLKELGLWANP